MASTAAAINAAVLNSKHKAVTPMTWDPAALLLSRFGFGPTLAQRRAIARAGGGAAWARRNAGSWYATQVALGYQHTGYSGVARLADHNPLLSLSPEQTRNYLIGKGHEYGWEAMDQLAKVTLGLQASSPAQLYESLVSFFSDHLHVPNHIGPVWVTRHTYDRDVIRANAMGSFTEMLLASAKHPAMLRYLNLSDSTKAHPNENYAREMLELHTVGLNFSQSDVTNVAKLLTGRRVSSLAQAYYFDPKRHATGVVNVLGFSDANTDASAGEAAGDALLRYLAGHPLTAQHLARKMCIRFVADNPSDKLVNAVAQEYLRSGTQILPMVTAILRSHEFWESRGRKVRRPAENLLGTVRALGVKVTDWPKAAATLRWQSEQVGHLPLDWPAPNGYPDVASAWRSSGAILDLWTYQLGFAGNWWRGGFKPRKLQALFVHRPHTSGEAIDMLTRQLTGMQFSAAQRASLQHYLKESARTPMSKSKLRNGWTLQQVVGLILHSPQHALR